MLFSEYHKLPELEYEWFDTVLSIDSNLFLDPFLIYKSQNPYFEKCHAEVIKFFEHAFKTVARASDTESTFWKQSLKILSFPEVEELCLGFTIDGTGGAGSAGGFANILAGAVLECTQAGFANINHFEEFGLFKERIGKDRISDATANILKPYFIKYTQDICRDHNIPTKACKVRHGIFNYERGGWEDTVEQLPYNPYNFHGTIITPKSFLRHLPTINSDSFWTYCLDNESETLRNELNIDITSKIDKKAIIRIAQEHPDMRKRFIQFIEGDKPIPYNFKKDRLGILSWYKPSKQYCTDNPTTINTTSEQEFILSVRNILNHFQIFITNNRGWELLINDDKSQKRESAAQSLLLGIVKHYCQANDIDISKEVNIGRGPVDFKFSQGYSYRCLLELKKANNTKYWNGFSKQLPKYLESENIIYGFYMIIIYNDDDIKRIKAIQEKISNIKTLSPYKTEVIVIDARQPLSASHL
ncbi:hypothetical protein [Fundidesulfovibrio putealis]|uniref:hypothetical protein n=1 Tax=Fundidesulfovibrio putealis TaxID=270496 RepID=UPI0004001A72|nr:hypothetical protein [Fundidesulfovibrio putealis]